MFFIQQLPNRFDTFLVPVVQVLVVHGCLTQTQPTGQDRNGMETVYVLFKSVNDIILFYGILVAIPDLFGSEQVEFQRPFLELLQIIFAVQLRLLPCCVQQLG